MDATVSPTLDIFFFESLLKYHVDCGIVADINSGGGLAELQFTIISAIPKLYVVVF